MQSWRFTKLLQPAVVFILSVALLPAQAFAADQTDTQVVTTGEAESPATEASPSTWDKTKEVSGEAWDATKEGSAEAWAKTKEVSAEAWDATKEGSAKAWDKTKELTQPDADEEAGGTVETPQH